MDWIREHAPWLDSAANLVVLAWVAFTGLVSSIAGAIVAGVMLRRDVTGLQVWRKKHEEEAEVGFADIASLKGQVTKLSGRFGIVERAQAEASARATEDRQAIADLLSRIDGRIEALDSQQDTRFADLTKRIDGLVDSRLRGK